MCGRYVIEPDDEEHFFEHFGAALSDELFPNGVVSYNLAPTQSVPVVRLDEKGLGVSPMHWGLIPGWAKDRSMASKMINARSETVHEKPSFRNALKKRRCVVPASGWYEWRKLEGEKVKTPFYFKRSDDHHLLFAGLWEEWTDQESGEIIESCTILTQPANASMVEYHHRMPVVLREQERDAWLDLAFTRKQLPSILEASQNAAFSGSEVSRDVGKVANNRPDLIAPVMRKGLFD